MTTTIEHDPDDPRGCIACPLFHGVPRDGGCRALDGPNGMNTLNHGPGGRFVPDFRCPLRNGGVHVRAPLPVADHHEPAEGDAVRVEPSPLASIATTLGMAPDALPGAIVERVERLVLDARIDGEAAVDVVVRLTRERDGLAGMHQAAVGLAEQRKAELDAVRETLAARDDETTLDAARRVVRERDEAQMARVRDREGCTMTDLHAERDSLAAQVVSLTERLHAAQSEAASLRAERGPIDTAAIRAGINAGGSRPEDVQARIGAHRALDALAQGQPSGVALSAGDDAAGRPLASERSE